MRATFSVLMFAALTIAAAQHQHDPGTTVKGSGKLPAGWQARLDSDAAKLDTVVVTEDKGALTFTTGPAGIYYKSSMKGSGDYQVAGTFSQLKPSAHPEAYGIFIGGIDLDKPTERYTYFLVRQDGKYLIKSRDGSATKPIVDWTAAPPMNAAAIASSSNDVPAVGLAWLSRPARITPASAASTPMLTKIQKLTALTLTPESVAACRLPPTA